MKFSSLMILAFSCNVALAQKPVGIFENYTDVGNPKISGSTTYNDATQTYTLKGAGYNIWFNRDEFQFAYKKLSGDFLLTADFDFWRYCCRCRTPENRVDDTGINRWRGSELERMQTYRWSRGSSMETIQRNVYENPEEEFFYPKKGGQTIQLERIGKNITMRIAHVGEPFHTIGTIENADMKDTILAGIYICSHDSTTSAEAKVWNVRIDKPVYHEYSSNPHVVQTPANEILGCRLEIMNVFDGMRKVIRESTGRFEAPNWMPDGKKLLFNENGSLYTIPIEGGTPEKLNTGSADHNNNDHVISFDGKMLGISSHRQGLNGGGSTVYTVPLTGGDPKLVTENTPSYLHGWNPNGKELVIVAQRNGSKIYQLYKVSLKDNKETALTNNKTGHVDGPEYSPDGKYIYYNANASGTMQIWRMKPDGSDKEQLTFDDFNNWFPHISPDGKWMAFISFQNNIDPSGHPSYKHVLLRLMPLTTPGAPRVIAYLFGGQGTINTPSWSPDSKNIAFVSNSEKAAK